MTSDALHELELLAGEGGWEAAQQLFQMSLRPHGRWPAALDELALAVFARDADRTRAAVEKLRSAEASAEPHSEAQ